jgi:hypothetical protein
MSRSMTIFIVIMVKLTSGPYHTTTQYGTLPFNNNFKFTMPSPNNIFVCINMPLVASKLKINFRTLRN